MKTKTFEEVLENQEENSNFDIATFIGKLFQSRDITHLVHLKTNSYAEHKALNSYYDAIVDLIDSFVEQYQGSYGILNLSIPGSTYLDVTSHLNSLVTEVVSCKRSLPETDGSLMNTLDSMQELMTSTLYKIKFLK